MMSIAISYNIEWVHSSGLKICLNLDCCVLRWRYGIAVVLLSNKAVYGYLFW
jgi:hypothetical protein